MQNTRVLIIFRTSTKRHCNSIKINDVLFLKCLTKKFLGPTVAIGEESTVLQLQMLLSRRVKSLIYESDLLRCSKIQLNHSGNEYANVCFFR